MLTVPQSVLCTPIQLPYPPSTNCGSVYYLLCKWYIVPFNLYRWYFSMRFYNIVCVCWTYNRCIRICLLYLQIICPVIRNYRVTIDGKLEFEEICTIYNIIRQNRLMCIYLFLVNTNYWINWVRKMHRETTYIYYVLKICSSFPDVWNFEMADLKAKILIWCL